ncbi:MULTISPECIES: restriction endonuclease [Chromobacterium]|uniref:restriction endonuclease n=1 Tax=Chromobacterium TaxID=535 RepID=UPI001888E029|nr:MULTISPECIES: restriction endonuclease [Chromobacterium]QOZ84779.1 endonuclease [Chromobacterium sp. Rain0013]WON84969.1 restriction endonuclease [Chromobacterium haemolyticum]
MARKYRKRKESFVQLLVAAPWYVSAILAGFSLLGLKSVLPAIWAKNPFLKPIADAFSALSWPIALFFLAVAAWSLLRRTAKPRFSFKLDPVERPSVPPLGLAPRENRAWKEPEATRAERPAQWTLALIRDIEWKRFEDVCQKFYELKGIRSETTQLGPDGGIDIRLFQDDSGRATSVVQCKAWGERYVGVKPIRELLGVMTHEKIAKAFFMTSGRFSDDAKIVARSNRITLIDGEMLLTLIERLPSAARQQLLEFATAGDYRTPTCPGCGIAMRHVAGKAGRPDFWGCPNYPRCKQILGMRQKTGEAA